ncbi:MAG: TVP38/TMEM64 family protein [Candidatus Nanohaloarchaea archaeon]
MEDTKYFSSRSARRDFVIRASLVTAVLLAFTAVIKLRFGFLLNPEEARNWVAEFGFYAPLVFVLVQTVQVILAPIPGQITAVASGYLFGVWKGTLYSMVGIAFGSLIAFQLSRMYGRPYVERVLDDRVIDDFHRFAQERGELALFVIFLVPGLPDDAICFLAGLTDIDARKFLTVLLVARTPSFFLSSLAGSSLATSRVKLGFAILVVGAMVSLAFYRWREVLGEYYRVPGDR